MTVRELVRSAQKDILNGDLPPMRAAELLSKLTSLLGNCLDEIREADMAYANVLLTHLDGEEAANRAKIRAQTTPQYARAREAKDTKDVVLEMIRSLKVVLKVQAEEMKLSR